MTQQKTNLLSKAAAIAAGTLYLGKDLLDSAFDVLEKQDMLNMKQGKEVAESVKAQVKQTKTQVKKSVISQARGFIKELGILTVDDLEELKTKASKAKKE